MKKIFNNITLLFLLIIVGNLYSQSSQDFTKSILGSWIGNGTLFKQQANFNMKWENDLNDQFIKLSFKNSFEDQSGVERVMKASAYYSIQQNVGQWFDTRGMILPLKLEISENSMVVFWGNELTERGKTIYTIIDNEHLTVQDFVFNDISYLQFGEATYERLKE
jgi:hypothetical protein